MNTHDRITMFLYLLTRGSPECSGLPWGAVNGLIKALPAPDVAPEYTSSGGEALARELASRLLEGVDMLERLQRLEEEVDADTLLLEQWQRVTGWNGPEGFTKASRALDTDAIGEYLKRRALEFIEDEDASESDVRIVDGALRLGALSGVDVFWVKWSAYLDKRGFVSFAYADTPPPGWRLCKQDGPRPFYCVEVVGVGGHEARSTEPCNGRGEALARAWTIVHKDAQRSGSDH